jgi:hypothetical protein
LGPTRPRGDNSAQEFEYPRQGGCATPKREGGVCVKLVNILQVLVNNVQSTQVEGENVQIFKYLNISMDKYVFHYDFHVINMDDVDIVLGYPWMDSVGTININLQKKFLKLWYNKNKITL